MAGFFSVKGWVKFQHYKDRNPPWIRFYNTTLDDYDISRLPDASKAHLFAIWLLASRYDNKIPYDQAWVATKINATEKVDLDLLEKYGLIELDQSCSNLLAERSQSGTQRQSRERVDSPPIVPPRGNRQKPGTPVTMDWSLTEKDVAHAIGKGYQRRQLDPIGEQFRDHHIAKGTISKDWAASWRTWVANDLKFHGEPRNRPSSQGKSYANGSGRGNLVDVVTRLKARAEDEDLLSRYGGLSGGISGLHPTPDDAGAAAAGEGGFGEIIEADEAERMYRAPGRDAGVLQNGERQFGRDGTSVDAVCQEVKRVPGGRRPETIEGMAVRTPVLASLGGNLSGPREIFGTPPRADESPNPELDIPVFLKRM